MLRAPLLIQYDDQAHQDIVKALMKAGAEQFIKSKAGGLTPFHVAKTRGNEEVRKLLKVRVGTPALRSAMLCTPLADRVLPARV